MEIKRDRYVRQLVERMGNGAIKVVTGVRRCGKSYLLLNLFEDYLRQQGVAQDHIIEVALDDDASAALRDPGVLYAHIRSLLPSDGSMTYVILDEVQYAISREELHDRESPPRLYGVLNGLLRMRNVDVYVTGSNSKLLSTDVMTEFRGRGDEVRVRPLSFAEFMQAYGGDYLNAWADYSVFGGLPFTLSLAGEEQKMRYLERLFAETYLTDIIERNGLEKAQELEDLIDVLASNIGALTSPSKLADTFKSELGSGITDKTVKSYIGYLKDAFLVEEARRFDVKGRRYIGSPKKYYFTDVGLRNARLGFRQVEPTHIMENVVYNELVARGYVVDVGVVRKRGTSAGKSWQRDYEVDFVANKGSSRCYVQAAYALPTPEKTAQEKASLLGIPDSFKKVVVVRDVMRTTRDDDGIVTMGLYDFLLDPDSLS